MLEKILEEIIEQLKVEGCIEDNEEGNRAVEIIRKHIPETDTNDGWITAKERLPENAKHKGAFCPKCRVETKYGETVGWYNPDHERWYVLLWFMTECFREHEIDLWRGDVPKVVSITGECGFVLAWRPLPKPYSTGNDTDPGVVN